MQADGFYRPPEWSPDKGSLKKFTGSKGHNQYEQKGELFVCSTKSFGGALYAAPSYFMDN
jgi:hypothetical protein